MKRTLFAIAVLTLTACSKEQAAPSAPAPAPAAEPAAAGTQKENSPCGGLAGRRCAEGLECHVAPPMYPDKSGICLKKK